MSNAFLFAQFFCMTLVLRSISTVIKIRNYLSWPFLLSSNSVTGARTVLCAKETLM